MKRYSFWKAFFLSFYSRDLYADVAQNWRGLGFVYLFILLAILWILPTYRAHQDIKTYYRQEFSSIVQQLPVIKIKQGLATVDKPTPYVIFDMRTKKPIINFIMGVPQKIKATLPPAPLALTDRELILSLDNIKQVYPLQRISDFELDKTNFAMIVGEFVNSFGYKFYFVLMLFDFVLSVAIIFLLGFLGLIIAKICKRTLDYVTSVRVISIAVTPALFFKHMTTIFSYRAASYYFLYGLIALGFIVFGIYSTSNQIISSAESSTESEAIINEE